MSIKMKFETPDLTAANVAKIAALFPGVVAEGKVNIDLLRTMLGDDVHGDEAYEFTWVGKRAAIAEAGRPINKTLRPVVDDETLPAGADSQGEPYCSSGSRDWDTTENLYIEGDNLDVLKLLQESYLGKVKMIYIDPPYNTGNDFVYRDNFAVNRADYEADLGVFDEEGGKLFKNTDTNGRFHSDWCSMMYPRLVLARNMLREDGVIFISIDDGEVHNLRKICDEVFGTVNFIANILWQKRTSPDARKVLSDGHEHILLYAKSSTLIDEAFNYLSLEKDDANDYKNPDNDPRGAWRSTDFGAQGYRPNQMYKITTPTGKEYSPSEGRCWKNVEDVFLKLLTDGRIWFGADGNGVPRKKVFLSEKEGKSIWTWWTNSEVGHTQEATQAFAALLGSKTIFDYSKPVRLIRRMVALASNSGDVILDFFSGSATTAHAVMQLNAEDGGKRKFIMVQLPELCAPDSEAAKAGYKNICEIGKERIRRAGDKIKAEVGLTAQNLDIGFRVLKLDDTNMKDIYYAAGDYTQDFVTLHESNIKPDRTDMDLLFACLLDWGLLLSLPHTQEQIDGFTVHTYKGGDLVACFADRISEKAIREIAKRQPTRVVFRDSGFGSSPDKINVFEIFKLLAPNTTVRVI